MGILGMSLEVALMEAGVSLWEDDTVSRPRYAQKGIRGRWVVLVLGARGCSGTCIYSHPRSSQRDNPERWVVEVQGVVAKGCSADGTCSHPIYTHLDILDLFWVVVGWTGVYSWRGTYISSCPHPRSCIGDILAMYCIPLLSYRSIG
jgi:hypothetical protein